MVLPITWEAVIDSGIEFPFLHNKTVDFLIISPCPSSLTVTRVLRERNPTDRKGGYLADRAISEEWSLTQNIQIVKVVICDNAKECKFTC